MASMKDFLEKTILRVGSRGAMPGTQWIDYSNVTSFVAPADGWAYAHVRTTESGGYIALSNSAFSTTVAAPSAGHVPQVFLPMRRGDSVRYETASSKEIVFGFIKSVGGA